MIPVGIGSRSGRIRRSLLLLAAVAAIGFAACSRPIFRLPAFSGTPAGTRGYILISIDTLRADHLGCYGHHRDTSPFIDSLASRGVLFENAYAQLPGTLPSHMSIFTGLYPAEHGVYPPNGVLSKRIRTLPEVFSANGFRTAGHTEGGYVHGAFGFARGFDEFSDESWKVENDVERTLARGVDFLERLGERDRFFLFLHTYAVHDPYPDSRSKNAEYFDFETYSEPFWPGDPPARAAEPIGPRLVEMNRLQAIPDGEVLEYYRAAYDAQIRYLDDLLRGFFDRLETLGLSDEVTVILTSDHGEEFAEHGRLLHEQVYRETLHVPLILVHPDSGAGRRIPELVRSIDVAPTFYELAGIESPSPISGQSLLPLLDGSAPEGPREAFAEGVGSAERTLVRQTEDGVHQLVWWPRSFHQQGRWMSRELSFDTFGKEIAFEVESFHQPRVLEVLVDDEPADVEFELPGEEAGVWVEKAGIWVSRAVAFGSSDGQVQLKLQSFHRPRWIEIYLGQEKLAEVPRVHSVLATGEAIREDEVANGRPGEAWVETDPVVVELNIPATSRRRLRLRSDGCDVPAELGISADGRCLAFQILDSEGIDRVREASRRVVVTPEPRMLHLDLSPDGKKRVTLRAASCGVPAELGLSDDPRCLSFRLSLPELWYIELYDNARDLRQASDLSSERSDLSLPMLRALNQYHFEPVAPPSSGRLKPELEERLRALGYLP